jgi:hypothetical protein
MFPTMTAGVRNKIIDIFLDTNRAHALSNLLGATAKQVDPEGLLNKIRLRHGARGVELVRSRGIKKRFLKMKLNVNFIF